MPKKDDGATKKEEGAAKIPPFPGSPDPKKEGATKKEVWIRFPDVPRTRDTSLIPGKQVRINGVVYETVKKPHAELGYDVLYFAHETVKNVSDGSALKKALQDGLLSPQAYAETYIFAGHNVNYWCSEMSGVLDFVLDNPLEKELLVSCAATHAMRGMTVEQALERTVVLCGLKRPGPAAASNIDSKGIVITCGGDKRLEEFVWITHAVADKYVQRFATEKKEPNTLRNILDWLEQLKNSGKWEGGADGAAMRYCLTIYTFPEARLAEYLLQNPGIKDRETLKKSPVFDGKLHPVLSNPVHQEQLITRVVHKLQQHGVSIPFPVLTEAECTSLNEKQWADVRTKFVKEYSPKCFLFSPLSDNWSDVRIGTELKLLQSLETSSKWDLNRKGDVPFAICDESGIYLHTVGETDFRLAQLNSNVEFLHELLAAQKVIVFATQQGTLAAGTRFVIRDKYVNWNKDLKCRRTNLLLEITTEP